MRCSGKVIMSLAAILIPGYAVLTAWKWPYKTALFPLAIGIPVIILGIVDLFLISGGKESPRTPTTRAGVPAAEKLDPAVETRKTVSIALWIFLFFLMFILFGFSIAVPLYVFMFLKIKSDEKWAISIVLSALAGIIFYGLFVMLAEMQMPAGLITRYIFS